MTTTKKATKYPTATARPKTGWFIVTPEIAEKWLAKNHDNFRRMKPKLVEMYAKDILEDRWRANPQPIVFLPDGSLADGQHRLAAIMEAGKPVTVFVLTNAPKECVNVIDTGTKRSSKDILVRDGWQNAVIVASSARMLYRRSTGDRDRQKIPTAALAEYAQGVPFLQHAADLASSFRGRMGVALLRPSAIAAFLTILRCEQSAVDWLEQVITQEGLVKGTGGYLLFRRQNNICARAGTSQRESAENELFAIFTAWFIEQSGRKVKSIRVSSLASMHNLPGIDFEPQLWRRE